MKKITVMLALMMTFGLATMNAQSCDKLKHACSEACAKACMAMASSEATDDAATVAAVKLAALDDNIEKRVCPASGHVSYVKKSTCSHSGKVSYTDVVYDGTQAKFVSLEEAPATKSGKIHCTSAMKARCSKMRATKQADATESAPEKATVKMVKSSKGT